MGITAKMKRKIWSLVAKYISNDDNRYANPSSGFSVVTAAQINTDTFFFYFGRIEGL